MKTFFQVRTESPISQILTMVVYRVYIHFCNTFWYGRPHQMDSTLNWNICLLIDVKLRSIPVRHELQSTLMCFTVELVSMVFVLSLHQKKQPDDLNQSLFMLILPGQHAASSSCAFGGFDDVYKSTLRRRSPQRLYNFTLRYDTHGSQQGLYFVTLSIKPKGINVPT